MSLSVVRPISSAPSLGDLAGQLRALADRIEAGEVEASAAYVILDGPGAPDLYAWGEVRDAHGVAGLLMHCAQRILADAD